MSSRLIAALDERMQPLAHAFADACAAEGIDLLITCTLRSKVEQAALYEQGRTTPGKIVTNARAGQSAHNYGLGMDVVPLIHGKPDWDGSHPVWATLGAIGVRSGLEWAGAPGFPFHELAHFQFPNWREAAGIAHEVHA